IRELADYIIKDLKEFRQIQGDETLGGMVICQTSEQARKLFDIFQEKNKAPQSVRVITEEGNIVVGEVVGEYHSKNGPLKAGLILHDSQDKETRKQIIKDFKKNMTIDILIVFNMLLTGFDAPRLKRLYFGRKLKDHNLLQAITRVNRPYKSMRYGYVIDFADIKRDFDETNQAYLEELNRFNEIEQTQEATNINTFSQVIEDKEEIVSQMKQIRQILFNYTYDNIEEFSSEISTQEDKLTLHELKHALTSAKDMANLVRTFGDEDLKEKFAKLEIKKLPLLLSEIQHRINIINQKELFSTSQETTIAINEAMKDIEFKFSKISSEEMKIISGNKEELKDKWQGVISGFTQNIDHEDPEYISLREAFMLRFKEYGFSLHSIDEFYQRTKYLDEVMERLKDLQKRNNVLLRKYNGDMKFTRLHKRIREENERRQKENKKVILSCYDDEIMLILNGFKDKIDLMIYDNNNVLNNEAYFNDSIFSIINDYMYDNYKDIDLEVEDYDFIQTRISRQYMSQYNTNYTEA
ncbi:MAG: type I restriction endonuclease subunit R, partial [Bacteroidales bacterium]|nr:type I restriction endonuclease subunit R [Bacteroidales bacterium]